MAAPIQPTPPVPTSSATVPVVPTTVAQQKRRASGTWLVAVGMIVQSLVAIAPQIQQAYPAAKWFPIAVTALGAIWLAVQRSTDVGAVTGVNYSGPSDGS